MVNDIIGLAMFFSSPEVWDKVAEPKSFEFKPTVRP
jgi:hypothetical protein